MSLLTIVKKDLKIVLSDKKAFILLVAMPIILFSILSFALAGSFDSGESEIWDIHVGIVKAYDFETDYEAIENYASREDAKTIENILFDVFDDETLSFISYEILDYETAVAKLDAGDLASIVILPENYISNLMINMSPSLRKPINIEVIKNVDMSYSSGVVYSLVNEIAVQMSQIMISNKVTQEVLSYYDIPEEVKIAVLESLKEMGESAPELTMIIEDHKIDQLKTVNSAQYYSVAMMAMFLLFGASYGAKFMLEEKKKFTLQRQTVAGLKTTKIIAGKMLLIFAIAVLQISMMILTSSIGFNVYWGSPIYVLLLTCLTAFSVTGFGAILAAVSLKMDSLKALNLFESGIFQVLALFGGSYFPLYLMPGWFQTVSKLLLNGAALDAYHKLMMGAPLEDMLPGLLSLFVNGIVFLMIGLLMIKTNTLKTKQTKEEVTA